MHALARRLEQPIVRIHDGRGGPNAIGLGLMPEPRIKAGIFEDGEIANVAPEFEDCRRIAERCEVPLKRVMQAATAAYLQQTRRAEEKQSEEAHA